jgi:hypothetical protein
VFGKGIKDGGGVELLLDVLVERLPSVESFALLGGFNLVGVFTLILFNISTKWPSLNLI